MNLKRTQEQRSASTRGALIGAARELWAERGYAAVGTPEIARAAGVTRGALYHQFADKLDLFRAVVEAVEVDVTQRIAERVVAAASSPQEALRVAALAWLDACEDREVRQLILVDGPAVLSWDGLRDITVAHGLGLTEQLLAAALETEPSRALAHAVIGALNEAALYATEGAEARRDAEAALERLLEGLLTTRTGSS
jgi:AcrR family transcriptional regulator